MPKLSSDVLLQSNRAGVRFLLTDIDAGLTFLSVAHTTCLPGNRERSLGHAAEVYATVQRLLPRVTPLPGESEELKRKLAQLRRGLLDAGCSVEP